MAHPALTAGDVSARALAPYARAKRAAFADKARVTQALQLIIAHRRLANRAARFLQRRPALLGTLMGVIGDFIPPARRSGVRSYIPTFRRSGRTACTKCRNVRPDPAALAGAGGGGGASERARGVLRSGLAAG